MAQFEILKPFRDKYTKQVYKAGDVEEITVKRSKEIERNIGDGYLKRVETPQADEQGFSEGEGN